MTCLISLSLRLTRTQVVAAERLSSPDLTHDEYSLQPAWPVDTELVLSPGSNKVMLTGQRPVVRAVIQDAIDNLHAAMLFTNAFPDVCVALGLIKDCLLTAANCLKPGAKEVYERLEQDEEYMMKIIPLASFLLLRDDCTDSAFQPRAQICLIRSEVKERCNIITMGSFLAFGSALDIVDYVSKQLADYTYTFPRANSVSHIVSMTSC